MNASVPAACGAAYLIGSIPTGYWVGRTLRGLDIRKQGSGNLGATNVFRVLGPGPGLFTLAFDMAKGWIPVWIALRAWPERWEPPLAVAVAAVLGHTLSVFVKFKGGKGVATAAGAFGALMPQPMAIAIGVFALSLVLSRIVSLSSIVAVLALSAASHGLHSPRAYAWAATGIAALIIWKHRANVKRLLQGTEPQFSPRGPSVHP